jgi:ketosteroid isomerase-like protein
MCVVQNLIVDSESERFAARIAASLSGNTMDQQQARASADRFIDTLHGIEDGNAESIERMVDLFSDNAELSNPIIERTGGQRAGRSQVAAFWQNYRASFREIRSEFYDITSSERAAGLFWRSTGTLATGTPLAYDGVSLLEFDDSGKIARFKGYFDSSQVVTKAAGQDSQVNRLADSQADSQADSKAVSSVDSQADAQSNLQPHQ